MKLFELFSLPKTFWITDDNDDSVTNRWDARYLVDELMDRMHGNLSDSAIEKRYQKLKKALPTSNIKVWRGLDTTNLDKSNLGHNWSWKKVDRKFLVNIGAVGAKRPDENIVILQTTVSPEQVDWEATIAINMLIPHEREITLKKGTTVIINGERMKI